MEPKINSQPPPSMLVRKYRTKNLLMLGGLVASVSGIYFYTMWTVSRGAFTDAELNSTSKK